MPLQIEDVAKHSWEISKIAGALAIVFSCLMFVRKSICKFGVFIWKRFKFQCDMRAEMAKSSKTAADFLATYKEDAKKWNSFGGDIKEINKVLRNGISHKLARQEAQAQLAMESEETPIFMCDENGVNIAVSKGYLKLLDIYNRHDLDNIQWQATLAAKSRDGYLHSFNIARETKTTLRAHCEYQNPYSEEMRGEWKVTAPCVEVNSSLIFYGKLMAVDEKAISIATENGWHACLPKA